MLDFGLVNDLLFEDELFTKRLSPIPSSLSKSSIAIVVIERLYLYK